VQHLRFAWQCWRAAVLERKNKEQRGGQKMCRGVAMTRFLLATAFQQLQKMAQLLLAFDHEESKAPLMPLDMPPIIIL
jgi:hypothetical protein